MNGLDVLQHGVEVTNHAELGGLESPAVALASTCTTILPSTNATRSNSSSAAIPCGEIVRPRAFRSTMINLTVGVHRPARVAPRPGEGQPHRMP